MNWHAPCNEDCEPNRGLSQKGVSEMTFSFVDTRQLAVSLAGAFITSLLFVSAATSLPIA